MYGELSSHQRLVLDRRNALAVRLGREPTGWPTFDGGSRRESLSAWFPCARCDGTVPYAAPGTRLLCDACRDELLALASQPP